MNVLTESTATLVTVLLVFQATTAKTTSTIVILTPATIMLHVKTKLIPFSAIATQDGRASFVT